MLRNNFYFTKGENAIVQLEQKDTKIKALDRMLGCNLEQKSQMLFTKITRAFPSIVVDNLNCITIFKTSSVCRFSLSKILNKCVLIHLKFK